MKCDEMNAEMHRRIKAHRDCTSKLILMIKSDDQEGLLANKFEDVAANEAASRKELVDWEAPSACHAFERLLHLLAHALAAQIAFDEETLAKIRADGTRFQSPPAYPADA